MVSQPCGAASRLASTFVFLFVTSAEASDFRFYVARVSRSCSALGAVGFAHLPIADSVPGCESLFFACSRTRRSACEQHSWSERRRAWMPGVKKSNQEDFRSGCLCLAKLFGPRARWFLSPAGLRVTFSCLPKRKSPKRRALPLIDSSGACRGFSTVRLVIECLCFGVVRVSLGCSALGAVGFSALPGCE